jgi:translocation and assembly module TamB
VAETRADEIIARVTIEGPASAPRLTVSSVPDLPEDEILARLFFGRSATSLSPVQALRLVDAVSGAAGGQGLIGGLRDSFGLADFDLTTNAAGQTELRFGRYLSENIYTDVQVGAGGAAEASVNIDLTPAITARGSVTSSGESSIGLFYERDY